MPYSLDQNGAVAWSDGSENVDAGPGGNQIPYGMPTVQDQLTMAMPPVNDSPVPDDIAQSVLGHSPIVPIPMIPGQSTGNKQSVSGSVGSSHSGVDFSSGGAFDMAESPTKGLKGFNRDVAEGHNKAIAFGRQLYDGVDANVDEQRQANTAIGDIEAQKADANAQLTGEFAARQRQDAVDNAADYANIQHKVSAKMADYEASINDLASSTINPGRAYSSLTSPQKGGVLVTAFVTDFLGAKGIKTHGMDYINQAIDRDIQAQRDQIDLKKDVAAGKMNIYQMFKQQGDSDYLAAEKTRGAMTTAFQTEVIGKLAAFDSPMAKAKVEQANALINQKKLEIKANIAKEVQEQEVKYTEIAVKKRADSLQAASSAASVAESRRQFNELHKPQPGGNLDAIKKKLIRDVDGKVVGTVDAGAESRVGDIQDRVANAQMLQRQLQSLSDKITPIYKGPGSKLFKDASAAKYESEYHNMLYKIAKANDPGGRLSDNDIKQAVDAVPLDTLTTGLFSGQSGEEVANAVLANLSLGTFNDLNDTVYSNITPITDQATLDALQGGPSVGSLNRSRALNDAAASVGKPKTASPTVDKLVGDTEQWKNTDDAKVAKDIDSIPTDDNEWAHALDVLGRDKLAGSVKDDTGNTQFSHPPAIPVWFDNMEKLYNIALDPSENNKANRAAALEFFTNKANIGQGVTGGTVTGKADERIGKDYLVSPSEIDKNVAAAAHYYLMKLSDSPELK
jgi:hypothetical protein